MSEGTERAIKDLLNEVAESMKAERQRIHAALSEEIERSRQTIFLTTGEKEGPADYAPVLPLLEALDRICKVED